MTKLTLSVFALLSFGGFADARQSASPAAPPPVAVPIARLFKLQYDTVKNYLVTMAERMPAEHYGFQPAPEVRTFAAAVGHIAGANLNQCGNLTGRKHEMAGQDLEKTLTAKEPLVGALKAGFAFCDEYFNTLSDNAPLLATFPSQTLQDGKRLPAVVEKGASAAAFLSHNFEMYGYMAVYLRLKGLVPPSSEKR